MVYVSYNYKGKVIIKLKYFSSKNKKQFNNMKTIQINKWLDYSITLNNQIISDVTIKESLALFWKDIVSNLDVNDFILIQFKIKDTLGEFKSISYIQRVNKNDFNLLLYSFIEYWNIKSEDYHLIEASGVRFTYKVLSLNLNIKDSKITKHIKISNDLNLNKESTFKFKGYNLPCTMDITKWGNIHFYNDYTKAIVYKSKSKGEYHISLFKDYTLIELRVDNKVIIKFKDSILDVNDLTTFQREIKNQKYIFEKGNLKLKKIVRETNFISSINQSVSLSEKVLTMDLETRNINGKLIPYCVCIYDGVNLFSFYLTDYNNSNEMLEKSILSIMQRKYNGYRVYLHNFSNFDGIFLLNILIKLSDNIIPIIKDSKLIDIKFKFANSKYTLFFRDSYLILPSSLEKLALSFKVESKGKFPILFVNDDSINLNYVGKIPSIDTFINISTDEYLKYCNSFKNKVWDLKFEAIKYCSQDVVTLHQIILKFGNVIFDEIRLDISNYPTLSSLALGIFRCKFLGNYKIPIITGKIYKDIKDSYTGGSVDVYKPYGENLYCYDVNSLYPYIMKNYPMPTGNPVYFEGDILKYEDKPYGFFEVIVETPKDLKIPLLQKRIKTNNVNKTVTPLGNWKGNYLSNEIYEAMKLGYKFKILRGFLFKQEFIFKEFVDFFYEMKRQNSKDSAYFIIAKLILNSLYGRLGMNPEQEKHRIIDNSESFYYNNNYTVTDNISLDCGKELISYLDINKEIDDKKGSMNISIPIAAAVTAYARLYMFKFKNFKNTCIFYTDTDSITINKKLDDSLVGDELGQMKLEYFASKAVYLAPKVYYAITNTGTICKIKGFNSSIIKKMDKDKTLNFKDFEELLYKENKLYLNQEKWYKNISEGNISIKKEIYTLTVTSGKRELIYNPENKFVDTKPLNIETKF